MHSIPRLRPGKIHIAQNRKRPVSGQGGGGLGAGTEPLALLVCLEPLDTPLLVSLCERNVVVINYNFAKEVVQ
jgi:hypothetical protein